MLIRPILTALIVLGMHSSLCTGGIFALATSTVDALFAVQQTTDGPMSYGSIGYLSCKSSDSTEDISGINMGRCGNGDECITQLGIRTHDLLSFTYTNIAAVVPSFLPYRTRNDYSAHAYLARAGPLYENANILTHSITQLE